jgi:hypothetical protein
MQWLTHRELHALESLSRVKAYQRRRIVPIVAPHGLSELLAQEALEVGSQRPLPSRAESATGLRRAATAS